MLGNNEKKFPIRNTNKILLVNDIFLTIQGEGIFAGEPSIFLRMSHCNLACKFCDTDFNHATSMNIEEIISKIQSYCNGNYLPLIVITGGEPLLQDISLLCQKLLDLDFRIQIETNGTLYLATLPKHNNLSIVCSPKLYKNNAIHINKYLLDRITTFKILVSLYREKYKTVNCPYPNIPIYIQPMDEQCPVKNKKNIEYAVDLAITKGYRLSIQLHKFIGIK